MKLLSLIQLGLTALPAVAAIAVPVLNAAPGFQELSLEARDIIKRGLCTPTGPGYCNLGLKFDDYYLGKLRRNLARNVEWPYTQAWIYDKSCNVLGSYENVWPGTNIDSQLPWVMVCVALGGTTASPTWDFHYSNEDINYVRDCSCSDCSDPYHVYTCCQCAFRC